MVNPEKIEVATTRRIRRELPAWIDLIRLQDEPLHDIFNGIRCQPLAEAFRHCKGKVMTHRLAEAVREAEQKGLLGLTEAEALKKEFPL